MTALAHARIRAATATHLRNRQSTRTWWGHRTVAADDMHPISPDEAWSCYRDRAVVAFAAGSCVLALAACGASSKSGSAGTSSMYEQGFRYSDCMRSHGHGVGVNLPANWNPEAPAAKQASRSCLHIGTLIPGVGVG